MESREAVASTVKTHFMHESTHYENCNPHVSVSASESGSASLLSSSANYFDVVSDVSQNSPAV